MKTIFLVRHAKAEGQPEAAPLTEKGVAQAKALVSFFKDKEIDVIYSSPFKRAVDTIKPLADEKGLPIIEDGRLGERVLSSDYFPDWQEKLKISFEDFDLVFEGGESHRSGMDRAISVLEDVLQSDANNIILVSHGNLSVLLLRYFNESFGFEELMEMTNPDVFEIVVSDEETMLKRIWDDRI
ncbi:MULTISPECIES: histidine phosphatase family protein [unclassified Bacillus (in: firmicutes)]|uniref:histidine phosphatase family protein n=1 Tax=unclassified Bacillus (in: firmicutes) TaxID=185979 RepID=UPI0008E61C1E|nr:MULTISPECIES: histidine phosphatase family protein [unclassified Bacillus (in: firmicutes)]SFA97334.1 2,3-bisphosphoglycerate-dependent phosphoglycerate mutase [Bacillus sp. UNCCL13]SFQ80444.1 2,3-bisphosphoglycerate-dependent phosphoglycerate mutase [Bacillus sp. cl95]